jgi:hypothetical protein
MEKSTVDRIDMEILTQFATFKDLTGKRGALEDRMKKAELEKETVKPRIFDKVYGEYRDELQRLQNEIEPLAKEVERARTSIRSELDGIEAQTKEIEDRRDELVFRHRIGEFDEKALTDIESPLTEEYERLIRRGEELTRILAGLEIREEEPDEIESPPAPDTSQHDKTAIEDSVSIGCQGTTRHEPIGGEFNDPSMSESEVDLEGLDPPADAAVSKTSDGTETLVDPTEWLDEFAREGLTDGGAPMAPDGPTDLLPMEAGGIDAAKTKPVGPVSEPSDPLSESPDPLPGSGDPLPHSLDPLSEPDDPLSETAESLSELADPSDDSPDSEGTSECPDDGQCPEVAAPGFPILTIAKGAGSGKKLPLLPMTMTLGREMDNNIELKDVDVARYHARISFEAGKYVVQDLEGSSGTFVNDKKITEAALCPGDTIRAGSTELKFELE